MERACRLCVVVDVAPARVRECSVYNNSIGEDGAVALAHALRTLTLLEQLKYVAVVVVMVRQLCTVSRMVVSACGTSACFKTTSDPAAPQSLLPSCRPARCCNV